jgi:hypothetical protein
MNLQSHYELEIERDQFGQALKNDVLPLNDAG